MSVERLIAAATIALGLALGVATVAVYETPSATAPPSTAGVNGETVFRSKGCMMCHVGPGVEEGLGVAPDLSTLEEPAGSRVEGLTAAEYLRQSVLDPQAFVVSGFGGLEMPTLPLTTADVDALVEFLLDV
ncbi:MAG: c-type cytochrome [Acidimicrobiia bacterium]